MEVELTSESVSRLVRSDLLEGYRALEEDETELAKAFKAVINYYSIPSEKL